MTETILQQKDKRLFFSAIFLVIVHTAGIIGLHSSSHDLFLALTPFNLLISTFLLLLNHREYNSHFIIFCLLVFLAGFFIEVVGVRTEMIFGDYKYSNVLGFRIFRVPLIIGVNWLMLVYSAGVICERIPSNVLVKSLAGAALMVILDYFIEPFAMKNYLWNWDASAPPLQNYLGWFVVSFFMLLLFNKLSFNKHNPLALTLYMVQLVFFISFIAWS